MPATDELADIFGPVGYREFQAAAPTRHDELRRWALALRACTEDDFLGEAASAIHGSALTNSWRGNWYHEDCKASACHHESGRRWGAAGHSEECRGSTLYERAFRQVWIEQGHNPAAYELRPCTCGAEGGDS